jgi:predicted ester cyclase
MPRVRTHDTLEQNKAIMRRMLEAFRTGDTRVVKELIAPQARDQSLMLGLEPEIRKEPVAQRVQTEIRREREAFPDQEWKEELLVAEGDTVVLHWSMTGTNTGPFLGREATGKKVRISGTEFVRIKNGKIVEHDDDPYHMLELLRQLDLLDAEVLRSPEFE